jgi:hypothetical protein
LKILYISTSSESLVIGNHGFVFQHAKAQVAYNNDAGRALVAGCESGHSQETNVSKVADVFYNAVNAFCRPDSQKALAKLGLKVVKDWEKSEPSYKWPGDPAKMPHYVQTFTRAIKDNTPALFVDPFIEGAYASTDRFANYKGNLEKVTPWHLFRTRVGFYVCILPYLNSYRTGNSKLARP